MVIKKPPSKDTAYEKTKLISLFLFYHLLIIKIPIVKLKTHTASILLSISLLLAQTFTLLNWEVLNSILLQLHLVLGVTLEVAGKYWCSTCLLKKMTLSFCWIFSREFQEVSFNTFVIQVNQNSITIWYSKDGYYNRSGDWNLAICHCNRCFCYLFSWQADNPKL
jgi:hypothetical protein